MNIFVEILVFVVFYTLSKWGFSKIDESGDSDFLFGWIACSLSSVVVTLIESIL